MGFYLEGVDRPLNLYVINVVFFTYKRSMHTSYNPFEVLNLYLWCMF